MLVNGAVIVFCLCLTTVVSRSPGNFHPEYVNAFLHRASTFALFDSKAKKILDGLPEYHALRYEQCKKTVRNVLDMAKCIERLLDMRDIQMESKAFVDDKEQRTSNNCNVDNDNVEGSWIRGIFSMIYKKIMCRNSNGVNRNHTGISRPRPVKFRRLRVFKQLQHRSSSPSEHPVNSTRKKRVVSYRRIFNVSKRCNTPNTVNALRDVQKYFDQMNHVIRYTYAVGKDNEKFFKTANVSVTFKNKDPTGDSPYEQMRQSMSEMESFDDKGVVSILSPKLFNVLKESPLDPESKSYLSPNILSFQDDGMIPLPRLFQWSKSDDCETQKWIELLLNMTGGAKLLEQHTTKFGDHMKFVADTLYPRIVETQKVEEKVEKVQNLTSYEQKLHLERFGFVEMSKDQLELTYGQDGISPRGSEHASIEDNEVQLEQSIRQLAQMTPEELMDLSEDYDDKANRLTRSKRQARRRPSIFDFRILNPFGAASRVGNPNFLGNYIISPYAFFAQIFAPYMLGIDVLSPRFMIATIFSPVVLVFRVLSPSAFRLMLFSPLMLVGWVLVPEAFLAKIFSPKLLETRVLSPEAFSAIVLSPGAGVARIASPNAMNVIVLSPSFFTYGLYSGNRYVLQVLSPGIVGIDAHPLLLPF